VFLGVLFALVSPFWKELGLPVESHSRAFLEKALVLMEARAKPRENSPNTAITFFPSLRWSPDIPRPISIRKTSLARKVFPRILALDVWNVSSMKK
jgi:hypothetical protein